MYKKEFLSMPEKGENNLITAHADRVGFRYLLAGVTSEDEWGDLVCSASGSS